MKLANNFTNKMDENKSITAMNFGPVDDLHNFALDDYENQQVVNRQQKVDIRH